MSMAQAHGISQQDAILQVGKDNTDNESMRWTGGAGTMYSLKELNQDGKHELAAHRIVLGVCTPTCGKAG
jgi:hypothetical protein